MVGKPEVCDDPRFDSIAARSHNVVALYELAGACLADKTTGEWLALLRELEIPSARMSSLDDVMADPQLAAGGFFKRATPSERRRNPLTPTCRCASATARATGERLQPRLGEHSLEVLREAGLSESEIKALVASGATVEGPPKSRAAE